MKNKLIIIILSILLYLPVFFRTSIGADSYYFLNYACGIYPQDRANTPILSKLIFKAIGCNTIMYKLIGLAVFVITNLILFKNPKELVLMGLFLSYLPTFWKIEDDNLAYPFLALSVLAFYRRETTTALGWSLLSLLFWKGAVFYTLFYLATLSPWLSFTIIPAFYLAKPNLGVMENVPFIAVFYLLFGVLAYFNIKTREEKQATLFWTAIAILSSKYTFHLTLFLIPLLSDLIRKLKYDKRIFLYTIAVQILILQAFVVVWIQAPNQQDWSYVEKICKGNFTQDAGHWHYGYWIDWYCGKEVAKYKGHP